MRREQVSYGKTGLTPPQNPAAADVARCIIMAAASGFTQGQRAHGSGIGLWPRARPILRRHLGGFKYVVGENCVFRRFRCQLLGSRQKNAGKAWEPLRVGDGLLFRGFQVRILS